MPPKDSNELLEKILEAFIEQQAASGQLEIELSKQIDGQHKEQTSILQQVRVDAQSILGKFSNGFRSEMRDHITSEANRTAQSCNTKFTILTSKVDAMKKHVWAMYVLQVGVIGTLIGIIGTLISMLKDAG